MLPKVDRRNWTRFDKLFPVLIESALFGFKNCIARNISSGGLFLETREPLPLGCAIRVYFSLPNGSNGISATGQVKNHYYLNFGSNGSTQNVIGMGVRFTEFDDDGQHLLESTLKQDLH